MNEINPIDTGITQVSPVEPKKTSPISDIMSKLSDKIPQKAKDLFGRFSESGFYTNKKIFWPVAIVFGLMLLIIILGILFGSKGAAVAVSPKKTPPPFVMATPTASPSGDILTITENQLKDLNDQINSLDIGQNKLKPPVVNYDIGF